MKMSENTYNQLNDLLQKSFDFNAFADNCAYNIDYTRYPNIGNIYHHSFAHVFPQLADVISEIMIKLNARPVRKPLNGYMEQYADLVTLFNENNKKTEEYRDAIRQTIDIADLEGDYEIRIAMENFLLEFLPFVKQSDIWYNKAIQYSSAPQQFDVHFEELTTFIPVIKD